MRELMKQWHKLVHDRGGNAIVEFAIGSSILVSVFVGTFQFGYTFYRYNTLQNAVSAGARYASLQPYTSTTSTPSAAFQTAVQNVVVYGTPTGGTTPLVPDLTTAMVQVTALGYGGSTNAPPQYVTVSVSGYTLNAIFAKTPLTNKPSVTYVYQSLYQP